MTANRVPDETAGEAGRAIRQPWEGHVPLAHRIIEGVSTLTGTRERDLPPLYDAIDIELLERLVASSRADSRTRLTFVYAGCEVSVTGDGVIDINLVE